MTIQDAISLADTMKPNPIDDEMKIRWLSELDGMIVKEMILTHEVPEQYRSIVQTEPTEDTVHPWATYPWPIRRRRQEASVPVSTFKGYGDETDRSTDLLVKAPYSDIYILYLASKIDLYLGELDSYANTSALYNNAYQTFADYYNRTYRPLKMTQQFHV